MSDDNIQKLKSLQQDYHKAFSSNEGKAVLEDLEKVCFMHTTTINDNPQITSFNEGMRAVMLHIKTRMRMDIHKLQKEVSNGQS